MRPSARFSTSPRMRLSLITSSSVTPAAPLFSTWKVTRPDGRLGLDRIAARVGDRKGHRSWRRSCPPSVVGRARRARRLAAARCDEAERRERDQRCDLHAVVLFEARPAASRARTTRRARGRSRSSARRRRARRALRPSSGWAGGRGRRSGARRGPSRAGASHVRSTASPWSEKIHPASWPVCRAETIRPPATRTSTTPVNRKKRTRLMCTPPR